MSWWLSELNLVNFLLICNKWEGPTSQNKFFGYHGSFYVLHTLPVLLEKEAE